MQVMNVTVTPTTAITLLNKGGVGVMPTDTVYGLVARAHDPKAVARLYALKQRERKPGSIIAANSDQLLALGVPHASIDKVKQWWPNPLSVVLAVGPQFAYLHQGLGDVAVRVVAPKWLQIVLETTGPLLTSSANTPGHPSSITIQEAKEYFHDQVDFYVDGGDLTPDRLSSTIIKLTDEGIQILRQGKVKI